MNDYYSSGNFTKKKLPDLGLLKKQFYTFIALAFSFASYGQLVSEYTFEQSVGTYNPITNGTNMVLPETATGPFDAQFFHNSANGLNGTTTGGTYNAFPIGFNFTYAGNTFDGFYIGTDGWIKLGSTSGSLVGSAGSLPISTTTSNTNNIISAFGMDLSGSIRVTSASRTSGSNIYTITGNNVSASPFINVGMRIVGSGIPNNTTVVAVNGNNITMSANATSTSTFATATFVEADNISYLTTGDVGSRVLTVQWKNVVRWSGIGDLLNFQIKLYETSNKIEIVYNNIASSNATLSSTVQVGLKGSLSPIVYNNRTGSGANAWSESTAGTLSSSSLPYRGPAATGGEISTPQGLTFSYLVPVFVDPPACIASPTLPTNNATNIIATNFSWPSTTGAPTGYLISVGTNPEANNLLDGFDVGLVNSYNYQDLVLSPSTQYFWKITPYNENGESQGCVIWSFTSGNVPSCVTNFAPADGATNVARNPTFTWTNPSNPSASSFDVYFGTSAEPMLLGNYASAAAATAALPIPLAANTQYFVKVVPKNVLGEAQGCVTRTFTTGSSFLFCASGSTDSSDSKVGSFTLAGSTRPAATGCVTYTNRTGDAPFVLEAGTPTAVSISHGTCSSTFYDSYAKVFIDVNQNGVFDENEMFFEGALLRINSSTPSLPINGNVTLPISSLTGNTRLRLVFREGGTSTTTQACGTYTYGETQDYTVSILPAAACSMPSNVVSSNITTTTASLSWGSVAAADYFEIEYGITGFTLGQGTLVDDADVSPYVLEGLTPDSNYQFYIRSVCGTNDNSNWAGPFSFTTLPTCFPVTGVTAVGLGYTQAVVSWTPPTQGASSYNVQYGPAGFVLGEGTILSGIEASPFTISSLVGGTTYHVYVQSNCGDTNGTSQWSAVASVTPGPCVPTYTFGKTDGDLISNIAILGTTLSNNTGNAPVNPSYTFFTGQPNYTAELRQGTTYTVSVTVGTFGSQNLAAWIDFNNNAVFEASERIGFTTTSIGANGTATFQIQLPLDAPLGSFRLRVRDVWNTSGINIDPCTNYSYGETEDYNITIIEPITTVITPAFCGTTIQSLAYDSFSAVSIPDAQEYEFRIQNGAFTSTFVSVNGQATFYNFPGYQYGTTYDVSVRVKVADAYGPFGASCQISTTAAPVTTLQTPACGSTLANIATPIYAFAVVGAQMYEFEVTNVATSTVQTVQRPIRAFSLNQLASFAFGTEYSIRVRAMINSVWMPYGASCNLFSPAPVTQMRATYCGISVPSPASLLYANGVVSATAYEFEVTNTNNSVVQVIPSSTPTFRLNQLNAFSYGVTYAIRVRAMVNGSFGAYGVSCNISTPVPTTQLRTVSCGATLPNINSLIHANSVTMATQYTFEVTNTLTTVIEEIVSSVPNFSLSQLSVMPTPNATYAVRVKVQLGGTYGDYGVSCNVSTPILVTSLRASQCGVILAANASPIYANNVAGASGFRFEITNTTTNVVEVIDRETRIVSLGLLENPVTPATTYSIRVSALVGEVYIAYGPACNVTTPTVSEQITRTNDNVSVFEVKAYPNPFTQSFSLSIESSSDSAIEVNVYDMTGKLVSNVKNLVSVGVLNIGEQLSAGVYHVQVIQGENVKTTKVVKK